MTLEFINPVTLLFNDLVMIAQFYYFTIDIGLI